MDMLKKFEEEGGTDDLLDGETEEDDDEGELADRLGNLDLGTFCVT